MQAAQRVPARRIKGEWQGEGFHVLAREIPHKGGRTFGLRASDGSATLAYLPDHCPTALGPGPDGWGEYHDAALELAEAADMLLHDTQLLPDEVVFGARFGHAVADYAVELGRRAGARAVALCHPRSRRHRRRARHARGPVRHHARRERNRAGHGTRAVIAPDARRRQGTALPSPEVAIARPLDGGRDPADRRVGRRRPADLSTPASTGASSTTTPESRRGARPVRSLPLRRLAARARPAVALADSRAGRPFRHAAARPARRARPTRCGRCLRRRRARSADSRGSAARCRLATSRVASRIHRCGACRDHSPSASYHCSYERENHGRARRRYALAAHRRGPKRAADQPGLEAYG